MSSETTKRRRTQRYKCSFCHHSLRHSAYRRHQTLPHIYCPARNQSESSGSDSTFELSEPKSLVESDSEVEDEILEDGVCTQAVSDLDTDSASTKSMNVSDSSAESAPEVWNDSSDSESETESNTRGSYSHLHFMVSAFVSLFQLCFRVSDQAITLLLSFIFALLNALVFYCNDSGVLRDFLLHFPRTLYSLKQWVNLSKSFEEYVVCARCHTLYKKSECILRLPSGERGLKCDYVRYPNHPQRAHRKKCGTVHIVIFILWLVLLYHYFNCVSVFLIKPLLFYSHLFLPF